MLDGIILLKGLISPLSLLLGVPNVKTTYTKSRPETILKLLIFTFEHYFNVKWGHLTSKALNLLSFSIFTDSKAGDNCCGSGLVIFEIPPFLKHLVFSFQK